MDMKCYEFKDSRKIFKLLLISYLIAIISMVLYALREENATSYAIRLILINIVIIIIIYKLTTQRVYIGDINMKASRVIPYMMVDEISVGDKIYIKCRGGWVAKIKIIDIESNYDKYKELLDIILSKVAEGVANESGSAEELLERAIRTKKEKNKIACSQKNGKPIIGGWLKVIMVIAYFGIAGGVLIAFNLIFADIQTTAVSYQLIIISLFDIIIVVFMHKRMKNIKYALGARELVNLAFTLIISINRIIEAFSLLPATLNIVDMLLSILSSVLWIQIYFEYINNFDRPKYTLVK